MAASWGAASAARRTSVGQHRVGLVRHRRRPAAGALGELADLRPRQRQHVVGDPPPGVGAADGRVAEAGDRGPGGVPGRSTGRGRSAGGDSPASAGAPPRAGVGQRRGSSTAAAMVPAAPPTWTGSTSAATSSYASSTPVSQPAALRPNVVGTACWVSVRADHGRGAVLSRPGGRGSRPGPLQRGAHGRVIASRAQSISAVSTTSWLVSPRCSHRAASGRCPRARSRSSATSGIAGLPPLSASAASRSSRSRRRPGRQVAPRPPPARCPADTAPRARRSSTSTIAASTAASENRSPARSSPGHRRSAMPVSVADRRGRRSRPRPAAGCRSGSRARRGRRPAWTAGPRSTRTEQRVGGPGRVVRGQVGAGEEPVEQPPREDGQREERRAPASTGPGRQRGERVVGPRRRWRPAPSR